MGKPLMILAVSVAWSLFVASAFAGEIHDAARSGNLERVQAILTMDPHLINSKDENVNTPLHLASRGGHLAVVDLLLAKGAAIDAGDRENSTALDVAAQAGRREIVEFLVANGAEVNHHDENGLTPLHFAAYQGHPDVVRFLIDKGANVNATKRNGSMPLHGASLGGHQDVIRLLIEKGAEVNAANEGGYMPLHSAALGGQTAVVELLLTSGAQVNAKNGDGNTPLLMALWRGNQHKPLVDTLLRAGADVNLSGGEGMTPLLMAALGGNAEIVLALLARGADVNASAGGFVTPIFGAIRDGHTQIVKLLLDKGANPDFEHQEHGTPLRWATLLGHAEIAGLLLAGGARPDVHDSHFNRTPLHWAAIKGYGDLADLLVSYGANFDARDDAGRTPLEYAARHGHRHTAGLLTARGATAENLEENYGPSPFLHTDLARNEAALWYLGHCGWAIKTSDHFLVFDYWNSGKDPREPLLANGHINPAEIADQKVYVFVTHEHGDHYDPAIFTWASEIENIKYVYGFRPEDLPENRGGGYRGPAYTYVGPRQRLKIDDLEIITIEANDAGVGFLVKVDGLSIYHAGDHAGWAEGAREGYIREIDYLAGHAGDLDLAFLNVTGCHAHGREPLREGTLYTLRKLSPKVMIPTHAGDREYIYRQAAEEAAQEDLNTRLHYPENRGDRFVYRHGRIQ